MATVTSFAEGTGVQLIRSAVAQATTGQTDWIRVPNWATYAYFDYNLTAVAGTSPLADPRIRVFDFTTRDGATATSTATVSISNLAPSTQLTAAARILFQLGPGITGLANDLTNAATGTSNISFNVVLPPIIGFAVIQDRTSGNETYTYTVSAGFR